MRTKFNVEIDSGKCLLYFTMIFLYILLYIYIFIYILYINSVVFTEFKRLILGVWENKTI